MSLPAPAHDLPPSDASSPEHRRWTTVLASRAPYIAAAIALVAGFVALNTLLGGFYDDAFYVVLAKSLATGHGYRNLNLPGTPFATHYPPGYPLFLALLWWIGPAFPANVVLFKLANVLLLAVAAAFAYRLGRERMQLGIGTALVAVVAGTATTPALYLSSMVLSETMFLALAIAFLLWAEAKLAPEKADFRTAILLGVCAGLLMLVRTQAIALVAAVALVYALRRGWRDCAASVGAAAIVVLPWLLWVAAHDADIPAMMRGDYGSYFAWFVDGIRERGPRILFEAVRRNVPDMVSLIAYRLRVNELPGVVASLCVCLLGACGVARLARRAPVTLAFLLGYLGIAALWPFPPVRFLLGVWVLIMLLLASGAEMLLDDRTPNVAWHRRDVRLAKRWIGAVAAAVLVIGAVAYNIRGYARSAWATTEVESTRWIAPKIAWIGSRTDASAVIASDHDEGAIYLYTGRRTVPVTTFTAAEFIAPRSFAADSTALRWLTLHFQANYLTLSSVRLRPAAAAISSAATPLHDGAHQIVPWAFAVRQPTRPASR
jgi:hypothetical protein